MDPIPNEPAHVAQSAPRQECTPGQTEERLQEDCQQQSLLRARLQRASDALSVQAAAVAAQQAASLVEEERLAQCQRALELQEAQIASHFEEQRRQLLSQEERLDEEIQALREERAQFAAESAKQRETLEEAQERLEARQTELEAERSQVARERAEMHKTWKRRWDVEWADLNQEAGRLGEKKRTLEQRFLKLNGELELNRRQLDAGWNQLRREQEAWQTQRQTETARLEERRQQLEQREKVLRLEAEQRAHHWNQDDKDRQTRMEEIAGLDNRIRNYRRQLVSLAEEVASQEASLTSPLPSQAAPESAPLDLPVALPVAAAEVDHPPSPHDKLLEQLGLAVQDLEDARQQLLEQHHELLRVQQAWQWEWDVALTELALREADVCRREESLEPREKSLSLAEQAVQHRSRALDHLQQQLQCWEVRLFKQRSALRSDRRRVLAVVKARTAAAQSRQQTAVRLSRKCRAQRRRESERYQAVVADGERTRLEYVRLRELLRLRLAELDQFERGLLEQELVLNQVQQELLAQDPRPAEAEAELTRRFRQWEQLAMRPVQAVEQLQRELDNRAKQLERQRLEIGLERLELEKRRAECADLQDGLELEQARLVDERTRWKQGLHALQTERDRLKEHIKELEQQLERMAVLMVEGQRPEPPLALAA